VRSQHDLFLARIWELWNSLTAYDASDIALVQALDATFLTRNRGLVRSTPCHVRVELLRLSRAFDRSTAFPAG
jgi:predicted nucleic acid-binding protein